MQEQWDSQYDGMGVLNSVWLRRWTRVLRLGCMWALWRIREMDLSHWRGLMILAG